MDDLNPNCSESFKDFILKMLHHESNKRLTINEIKKHPWYNEETNNH